MISVNANTMLAIVPVLRGVPRQKQLNICYDIGPLLDKTLEEFKIQSRLELSYFLAQAAHETDSFKTLREYADGSAYEGREDLGNVNDGDGARYRGRGMFQITGRFNYRACGSDLGIDLEGRPELAENPEPALRIACWYWNFKNMGASAARDDLITNTRLLNGGLNGLAQRRVFLAAAKTAVASSETQALDDVVSTGNLTEARTTIRRGSEGVDVELLQRKLSDLGYKVAIDGMFGPGTETAVRCLQSDNDLDDDGIVGPKTWDKLDNVTGK